MPERERRARRRRLGDRVILGTLASSALGGALAAITAVLAVDRMIQSRGDQRLSGAAAVLEGEILEDSEEDDWEPLAEIVDDENGELVTSGIRLAVFSGGHRIAGDAWVPEVAAGRCESVGALGERIRACSVRYRDWVLVAAAANDERGLRLIYLTASGAALLLGGLCGGLASARLARWALRPLADLERSIRRLRADAPAARALAPLPAAQDDVVEVAVVREALSDLIARIHSLLEPAQRFAADAAHELRTPLTTLRGELELLIEETRDAEQQDALVRVSERVAQLSALVERLLVLASPLGEQRSSPETVALSDLIEEAVAALPAAQRSRVHLIARSEGLTRGEPSLLSAMIRNALDNALKFSADARVDVDLEEGEHVVVRIRDRGPGVPADLRDRVFEPFFRATGQAVPGHGLGLSLIGHIARAHGGSVGFIDPQDAEGGACLRVQLPRWTPAS